MRFLMLGSGAIGGTLGSLLNLAGEEVVFIDKNVEHVEAIRSEGLTFHGSGEVYTIKVPAATNVAEVELRPDDVIMLCVKTFDTEAALKELQAAAPREVGIFSCQNGVRNEEMAARYFTDVNGLMLIHSCTFLTPGVVFLTGPRLIAVGSYPSRVSETAVRVKEALDRTPLEVTLTESLMSSKWNKVVQNLNNATSGVTGLSVQEGQRDIEVRRFMADVMEEGINVLQAAKISYDPAPQQKTPEDVIAAIRAEDFVPLPMPESRDMLLRPSMWQDLYLRRGLVEADQFNGEIVMLGKEHEIPTPLNSLMLRISKEMSDARELPGKYRVADLQKMA